MSWRMRSPTAPLASESPGSRWEGAVISQSVVAPRPRGRWPIPLGHAHGTETAMGVVWHLGISSWFAHLFQVWKDEHEMLSLWAATASGRLHDPGRSHLPVPVMPTQVCRKDIQNQPGFHRVPSLAMQVLTFRFIRFDKHIA